MGKKGLFVLMNGVKGSYNYLKNTLISLQMLHIW